MKQFRAWAHRLFSDDPDGRRLFENCREFLWKDLVRNGTLHMGWGGDPEQSLKTGYGDSTRGHRRLHREVTKGHIIAVRCLPKWDDISFVKATGDFFEKYDYRIPNELGDYGHCFPVRHLMSIKLSSIRGTDLGNSFYCRQRFWNIDKHLSAIEQILRTRKR